MSSLSNSNDDRIKKSRKKVSEIAVHEGLETTVPLAPASALVGCGCFLDAQLNGAKIKDRRYSDMLKNGMIIYKFYHHKPCKNHGFVVFQTQNPEKTFMVHIFGERQCDGTPQIVIEIKRSEWLPGLDTPQDSLHQLTPKHLKEHIETLETDFNAYNGGNGGNGYQLLFNDCHHFSEKIAYFLKTNSKQGDLPSSKSTDKSSDMVSVERTSFSAKKKQRKS